MNEKLVFNYLIDERRYNLITKSGKSVEEIVKEFIKKHDVSETPILTEADWKSMKEHRTEINNLKKDIEDARKQTTSIVVNPLLDACKPLERLLGEASNRLTEKIEAFKPRAKKPKTTTIITVELPIDSELVNKVKTYLKRSKIAYMEEEK